MSCSRSLSRHRRGQPDKKVDPPHRVGRVGRTVTELLLKQGKAVRAMVRNEDDRAKGVVRFVSCISQIGSRCLRWVIDAWTDETEAHA
jgi:hypothetical protein